jgi:hypothetical protein
MELTPGARAPLVDAATIATELGVSRDYVYEHAAELGALRLGGGKRARLRFDPATARAALSRYVSEQSLADSPSVGGEPAPPAPRRRRSLATHRPQPGSILPSRPRSGRAS